MTSNVVSSRRLLGGLLALVLMLAGSAPPVSGQPVSDQIGQALNHYIEMDFEEGVVLAKQVLERDDLEKKDRIAAYSVLSLLTFALGDAYLQESHSYLQAIADLGPCEVELPEQFWPQTLRDQWYGVAQSAGALVCPANAEQDQGIRTIAIMEFDNYSTGEYQEKLGFLTKGLSDFFESDFSQLSELDVVERDKIDFILKEIMLTKEGMVEQSTAVKAGKLLGAQIMVFGSVVQLDKKNARMLVKAVNVETSEIMASAERQGKPDFFAMQKELVKELVGKLDLSLNKETEQRIDAAGTESEDAAALYSRGLYHTDRYEYTEAYDYFKRAWESDQSFTEAKAKMDIYRPLAMSS